MFKITIAYFLKAYNHMFMYIYLALYHDFSVFM